MSRSVSTSRHRDWLAVLGVAILASCTASKGGNSGTGGGRSDASIEGTGGNSGTGGTLATGGTSRAATGGVSGGGAASGGVSGSGGAASGGAGGGTLTQVADAAIASCIEGLSCPQAGQQCTNAARVLCQCGGPPGSAFLTCNAANSGGAGGGPGSGGTQGKGGVTSTGGSRAIGGGNGGAAGTGGASGSGGVSAIGGTTSTGGVVGQPCSGAAPWNTGAGDYQIVVDASQTGAAWSRFYEKGVACDHANTLLSTAYGRNAQAALKKGHDQAGFQYVRFHGILNDDIAVYSESNGTAVYDWTRFDQVYDAIVAAGMRPIVEISFTPSAMASTTKVQTALWYNNKSPNISKPKDWTKWEAFMAAIVQHLEGRYGADEIRSNWFFEVWNEPSWMYELGDAGYNELYGHTAKGLAAGDPLVKIGGPAGSGGESPGMISGLVSYAKTNSYKLDFVSFHCYGNDGTNGYANANSMLTFYDSLSNTISSSKFTGLVINDEYGSSYDAVVSRDNEVAASFIAKTVHLIGTASKAGPPYMYAWWTISDLYEEFNTGTATAFREGNFGLLLKGDASIPISFDVAKPAFNAFRLLHMMGDVRLTTTGGTTNDGVNAVATASRDSSAVQILVYNHVNGGAADSSTASQVKLTINNLPGTGNVNIRHYMLDRTHSNSYQSWVGMGKPSKPSQTQWTTLSNAAELCYYPTTATGNSWTVTYPQNIYGVSLITLTR
jgi:xylan 1,4-beta-xylosidase